MDIEVYSRRKPIKGSPSTRGGVSDLDGLGVGKLVLVANDDADRKLITSIYRMMNPPRPPTMEQVLTDQAAAECVRRWLSVAQSRINLEAQTIREEGIKQ